MTELDNSEFLFVVCAFLFQIILIIHFILRKWFFDVYILQYGWIVYALSVPAAVVSTILLLRGKTWSLWLGGFLYLVWAIYGYIIEYVKGIQWRSPIHWPVFGPYLFLYLSTVMFYWWPLAIVKKPLWYVYAVMFTICTVLNLVSH